MKDTICVKQNGKIQAGRHDLEGVGEGHPLNNAKLDNSGWQTRPGRSG